MDEPKEDRMSLLQKFAALFRGEMSPIGDKPEPVCDMAGCGLVGPVTEAHETRIETVDVLPAETRVKLNCGLEGAIVAQYINRTGSVCYQIAIDGEFGRSPLPIYSRQGFEIITRPTNCMTLVIETPKS